MSVERQFARQIQLSEIGSEGQCAISHSALMVNGSADKPTVQLAKLYAQAAGFPSNRLEETGSELPTALRAAFRHEASRAVGLGAAYALASVLTALRLSQEASLSAAASLSPDARLSRDACSPQEPRSSQEPLENS